MDPQHDIKKKRDEIARKAEEHKATGTKFPHRLRNDILNYLEDYDDSNGPYSTMRDNLLIWENLVKVTVSYLHFAIDVT